MRLVKLFQRAARVANAFSPIRFPRARAACSIWCHAQRDTCFPCFREKAMVWVRFGVGWGGGRGRRRGRRRDRKGMGSVSSCVLRFFWFVFLLAPCHRLVECRTGLVGRWWATIQIPKISQIAANAGRKTLRFPNRSYDLQAALQC